LYAMGGYSGLLRSQDEGETWQVVLGYETGFSGYFNQHCFAVSPEGRICVFNDNQQTVAYSDDGGDTWQQTPSISSCAMPDKTGLCVPTNDVIVVWAENGEISYTLDEGETWDGWILDFLENSESVSDLLVNENGDVYVSVAYYIMNIVGIYHSTLSDIQNWELVAFEGISIKDMAFDPEGNVVACGYNADGSSVGFQHIPGFFLFDGTSLAISDEGIVYTPHFMGLQAVLSYSTDHGEHFTELGEHLPLVDIAPGGENARLFKGADNHLYFDGGGEYWKSIRDADHIPSYDYYPLIEEANNRQKWNVVYIGVTPNYPNDYHTEIQSIRDDINLDGVDYKLVWKEDVYDSKRIAGAVREEDKRVYFRRKIEQNYQEEVLLYDFNLMVGDTVTVNWMGQQLMVLEESEVEVDGTMRRQLGLGRYSVGYPPTEVDEYWIEGVGSTFGFLNSGSEGMGGAFIYLLCYHENGNLVWDNEAFDECVMNSDGAPATFAPQGAEWYFDVFNPWGTHPEYLRFFVDGDTIIQGHQCSIINQNFVDTGHEGGEFVYEEDNKVYWFNPTTNAFSTLYDFDAEAGESWYYEVGDCTHLATVDSVGSVTWNGHNYRTQWVRFNDDLPTYYSGKIIEGIGYERGLFPSIEVCNGWEVYDASEIEYLRCYVNDGEMLYHEGGYDCDETTITPPSHPEWYYEILNENGTITYQYMYQAGDTIIQDEPTHILVRINTLYDKGLRDEVTHEYVFELNGKLYWWNKRLGLFTVLYDYEAEVGDSWNIFVGTEILTMHVDAVEEIEYEGRVWRMLRVSDPDDLFSGNIVCGIGHLTSFFPERLMNNRDGVRVEGMRCYWNEGELVFKYGDEDCDAIISEIHNVEENGLSTGSGTFAVYPNPTNGVLFVETRRATSLPDQTYRITNLMGQTVMTGQITAETQQIDVSPLPQGMYFITVGDMTRKFVVR
ncbi:MAG: T9SS type A sorting domain-containing protein, partial [Bacteroidales bacterium]|nr:T9SS type A sorting domain-containing protein [Bacteroidales bacterium]